MPSLSDHIDHLTATAKAIQTSATSILPTDDNPAAQTGPFTRAVLDTPLGDLIRDIDTSELGLFSLVPPPDAGVRKQPENGPRKGEISRAGFPGATPLRRLPTKRDEATKPREPEPEVYAMAALKYLDRYQSIRPMPRARSQVIALTQQLTEVRANIKHLNETLQQSASSAPSSAPTQTSSVAEEENRIHELQDRLAELRLQKESLLRAKEPRGRHNNPSVSSKSNLSPNHRDTSLPTPASDPDTHERAFWSTPSTPARTLRFSEKLMDEEIKFSDVSTISFDSPEPVAPSVFANLTTGGGLSGAGFDGSAMDDSIFDSVKDGGDMGLGGQPESALSRPNEIKIGDHGGGGAGEEEGNGEEEGEGEEKSVVLSKKPLLPSQSPPAAHTSSLRAADVDAAVPLVESRVASNASKVKVTPELERIVAKIWSTVGEIILPGSPYSNGAKPPRAKETLAHIQVLAVQSPTPQSPTSSSVSSLTSILSSGTGGGPTPHQINTAQLLYTLLTAPGFAMQLNKLKAAIGGTRVLYACVAKKLIRIDRSSGEQVVHFDV